MSGNQSLAGAGIRAAQPLGKDGIREHGGVWQLVSAQYCQRTEPRWSRRRQTVEVRRGG
jgi:hypothetical protein